MSLKVRPDYVNPLTMMKENKNNRIKKQEGSAQDDKTDKLTELQTKQQALQNEMLLIQSTGSDSAGNTSGKLEDLQKKLEEVSSDLKVAQNHSSDSTEKAAQSQVSKTEETSLHSEKVSSASSLKPDVDTYKKAEKESEYPGIYRLEADSENSYKFAFSPYSGT